MNSLTRPWPLKEPAPQVSIGVAPQWRRRSALRRCTARVLTLLRRPGFCLALLLLIFTLLSALLPQLLTSVDPYATAPADKLMPPSLTHWFGTDALGRDLYSRVVYGSSLSVLAALLAVGIALSFGLGLGVLSGFAGGQIDALSMRLIDVLLALPGLLLALAIVTAIGYGTVPVAIAVGVGIIPGFARTTRAEVLRIKTLAYVEAARLGGASWGRTLLRHVLPNAWGPVAVLATLDLGVAIMATAALSFLGFGAAPPAAEWGSLIANGRHFLLTAPWLSLLPGGFLVAVVFSINHIARTLEESSR
jgi:peptide/nickel transport system permease protein